MRLSIIPNNEFIYPSTLKHIPTTDADFFLFRALKEKNALKEKKKETAGHSTTVETND